MPLDWKEVRPRAARFAQEWQDAHYEKGQTQTFYNEFFEVFGRVRKQVAIYERSVKKLNNSQGFIDLFWPGMLLIEQKSAGRSLQKAQTQAIDYCASLHKNEMPRYILLSDFQNFELLDLETGIEHKFALHELPDNIHHFKFISGRVQQNYKDQPEVNIEAASLMGNLHERLEESGYTGADLERLLVRIMFCLFAEDTLIFEPSIFLNYIEYRTNEDGSGLGGQLIELFQTLDTPIHERQKTLDDDLKDFPYVNGALFSDLIRTPSFNRSMREALLNCCRFNWSKVSPALFGSLFQMVMLPAEQRKGGAHYTSEKNILKTIHPLFLDELTAEFIKIRDSKATARKSNLEKFHTKLSTLTFLDPACGCGNFLILAYRELRLLELEVLKALHPKGQLELDAKQISKVDVDQFYGIEIEEFPARIAEAAMWLVDHQMNMQLSDAFGQSFVRLPLKKSAHIHHDNALTCNWHDVIAPEKLSYMLGNPPFVGSKYQEPSQRAEMQEIFANIHGAGVLDYVTAWFLKAAQFIQNTHIKVAFVSTNSITQGEQVGILWQPLLERYKIQIHFAHRTFKWTIDEKKAKGMKIAAVHTVIIGFGACEPTQRIIFEYDTPTAEPLGVLANNINPYLVDAPTVLISKRSKPLCDVPEMCFGNMPNDEGALILSDEEKNEFIKNDPNTEKFIKPFIGSQDFLNGNHRWCLWLRDANPSELKSMPSILRRIDEVKKYRLKSERAATKKLANFPSLFGEIRQPHSNYLLIPRVSSENRLYVPFGFFEPDNIVSDTAICLPNATLYHLGVLTSHMHMAWMRQVAGRLKSDYRYSNTLVYNNFPWPKPTLAQQADIELKAQAVLDARLQFPFSTLADLYNSTFIEPPLLKAHQALDAAVDAAYRKDKFNNERERVEYLFKQYQALTAPLIDSTKIIKKSKKRLA